MSGNHRQVNDPFPFSVFQKPFKVFMPHPPPPTIIIRQFAKLLADPVSAIVHQFEDCQKVQKVAPIFPNICMVINGCK